MKYVITGGAGFIGSHLASQLSQNNEVIVLDNLSTGVKSNLEYLCKENPISFVNGSVTDYNLLLSILSDVDGIFHQAALPSVPRSIKDPISSHHSNASGTLKLLTAAKDKGVPKVVMASSSSVYGDTPVLPKHEKMTPNPQSPYAVTKLTGEYYCKVFQEIYGLNTVCLRYFNVYGPLQDPSSPYAAVIPRFITRLLKGLKPEIYGDGTQTRDFTYVMDVVNANINAMESSATGVFNIAGGKQISLLNLLDLISSITGTYIEPSFLPPRSGDIHDSYADISKAKKAFGYHPNFSLETGLEKVISWSKK